MLCIIPLVHIFLFTFHSFIIIYSFIIYSFHFLHLCLLHQIQSPYNPASGNHKSDLFLWVYLFVFEQYWPSTLCELLVNNIVIQYFHTFQNYHHDKSSYHMPTKILCNYWLSSPQCAFHIPLTYLFCNWKFVSLSLLHLILSFFHLFHLYSHLFIFCIYLRFLCLLVYFPFGFHI